MMTYKKTIVLALVMLPFLLVNAQVNDWKAFQRNFSKPGKDYGSAPLWVWNTRVTDGLIDTMLVDFKAKGFGGVFVHPRAGLITPYLSPEWFARWKHTVEKAKQIGLNVWIYDENSYPSGFAGGHVPDAMPSSYNQGEMLEMKIDSVWTGAAPADEEIVLERQQDGFVPVKDGKPAGQGPYYHFTKRNYYRSPWYGGFSYVDLLGKGVSEEFLRQTMPGYEKAVGTEFGKTVKGIFSDEPNIEVQFDHCIRWTPDLFARFAARWGYRLEDRLPSLLEDLDDYKKIRHDYYATLLAMFIDRWSKPFSRLADSLHLEWTGHYWEHEWPNPNPGPDNMAMYAWPQRPGVDMLFNQFNEHSPNAQFGNVRAIKELGSVTNQLGKGRNLSETYGGGGWELSYKDMKRLGDWEFVLGVNTLNQHLAFMTITGSRKYDYPQSFSYHNPWWPNYKYLNDYFTRLTWALTRGQEINDLLVLEPTTTMWMYSAYDGTKPVQHELAGRFQEFVTKLSKEQVEYDLGCEDIIRDHGSVRARRLVIGKRAYSTVVIPPGMENIDSASYLLLKKFVDAGGKLVVYAKLDRLNGSVSSDLGWINERLERNDASPGNETGFAIHQESGGDLYHMRRKLEGAEIVFLTNSSMDSAARGAVTLKCRSLFQMDLFSGLIIPLPIDPTDGSLTFNYHLPAAGSDMYIAFTGNAVPKRIFKTAAYRGERTVMGTALKASGSDLNTLMIDFCDIRIGDTLLKDRHVYDAADTVYKHFGFPDGNPWNTSVQYKDQTIVKDHFPAGSGFAAAYHFRIAEGVDTRELSLVVEQPHLWKVLVNGHPVIAEPGKWWLDRHFGICAAGPFLKTGDNTVEVRAETMSVYAEVEPVYIRGHMGVAPAAKGFTIVPLQPLTLGSWKTQGMPLYGASVRYAKNIDIAGTGKKFYNWQYRVRLGRWKGTVATVQVNGQEVGVIGLDSDELSIGTFLRPGKNVVQVTITGSLKNLLGPHHNNPRPGLVSPWHWRYVKGRPSGDQYDTYDYGLYEDFEIVQVL